MTTIIYGQHIATCIFVCLAPETCHLTRSRFRVCVKKRRLQDGMFEKARPLDTQCIPELFNIF